MSKAKTTFTLLTFLTSFSTLLCCTLPALISVIAGSVVVSALFSAFPQLIILQKYHDWIFGAAAILLVINGFLLYKHNPVFVCPPGSQPYCKPTLRAAKIIYWISIGIFLIASFATYLLPYLLYG